MSTYQSKGIVFRNIKYSESSIICDIFTREKGLRSFIVQGVRNAKSQGKANLFRPLHIVDIQAYESETGKLARIRDIQYGHVYQHLNIHVVKSAMALFMLEIARNSLRAEDHDADLYDFLETSFTTLDADVTISPLTHIVFMIRLSVFLGFEPMQNQDEKRRIFDLLNGQYDEATSHIQYRMEEGVSDYFYQLLVCKEDDWKGLHWPKSVRTQMLDDLILYYSLHVTGFRDIVSKDVLAAVL